MRGTRKVFTGVVTAAALAGGAMIGLAAAHGPQGSGQAPGYGMGPGMMGQGYGMRPGMMGQGYGMGPGMMGQGMGQGYGMRPGMMGQGMGQGYGMRPGMGWGPGQAAPADLELSADAVRQRLQQHLNWHANPRLKLGEITEADDDTIVAEIVTRDGSLVQKLAIDRHSGFMRQME